MKHTLVAVFSCIIALSSLSCSSSKETESISVEERYARGMKQFEKENYLEAIDEFKIITVQFPASSLADDAQYFIAESRYLRGEYILAAAEYDNVIRTMSSSPLVPRARYMKGRAYYELSPKAQLDQKYTRQSIDDFQTYIEYSPKDSLVGDAELKITELTNKLAKKLYEAGRLYYRLEYYKAAIVYFDNIIEQFHDTDYADDALLWKSKALLERKNYIGALQIIDQLLEKFPSTDLKDEALQVKRDIESKQRESSPAVTGSLGQGT